MADRIPFKLNVTPAIFLSSIISFIATCYVAVVLNPVPRSLEVLVFEVFTLVYIFRVYLGLLMVTYDETFTEAMSAASPKQRRNYHIIFFWLLIVCLMVGYLFARFDENAGAVIVLLSSTGYIFWWFNFFKITFKEDKDRISNGLILFLDILCGVLALLFFFREAILVELHQDPSTALGIWVGGFYGLTGLFAVIFLLELILVHFQSLKSFAAETLRMCSEGSYK